MKLVFQIALGVFIGALASQYAFEQWRSYEAQQAAGLQDKRLIEQQKRRDEQAAKIREMIAKGLREKGLNVPDDSGSSSAAPE